MIFLLRLRKSPEKTTTQANSHKLIEVSQKNFLQGTIRLKTTPVTTALTTN